MTDGTVVLNQTFLSQTVQNVLVFSNIPEDDVGRQTMADNLRSAWVSNIGGSSRSDEWSLNSVRFVYNASTPIFSTPVTFTSGAFAGTGTGDPLPTQIALLVTTSVIGAPPNRGRIYFSGLLTGHVGTDGLLNGGIRDECVAFVEACRDGIAYTGGGGTAFLRIARRAANGTLVTTNPVVNVQGKLNPATQRRRRIGVGA